MILLQWLPFVDRRTRNYDNYVFPLLPPILLNPVPCRADGLLGDAHDVAHVLVIHTHLVEDEEESVMGGLGGVFLLDAVVSGKVDGFVVVDEAFVVVV